MSEETARRHACEAAQIADLVADVEPDLPLEAVLDTVGRAAVGRRARMMLLAWLRPDGEGAEGPARLTDPTPGGPKVVDRFTAALVAAGSTRVRRRQPRPLVV